MYPKHLFSDNTKPSPLAPMEWVRTVSYHSPQCGRTQSVPWSTTVLLHSPKTINPFINKNLSKDTRCSPLCSTTSGHTRKPLRTMGSTTLRHGINRLKKAQYVKDLHLQKSERSVPKLAPNNRYPIYENQVQLRSEGAPCNLTLTKSSPARHILGDNRIQPSQRRFSSNRE